MAFRIGRKYAQHTYPEARAGAPGLIQASGDLLIDHFEVAGQQDPVRVERDGAGALLEAPLNGFRRSNGLWIESTAVYEAPEADGDMGIVAFAWCKFDSIPEYFISAPPGLIGTNVVNVELPTDPPTQTLRAISVTFNALVALPELSSDVPQVPIPEIDNLRVGFAVSSLLPLTLIRATVVACEIHAGIITQIPTMNLIEFP